jgi:hypothetical protein
MIDAAICQNDWLSPALILMGDPNFRVISNLRKTYVGPAQNFG